MTWNIKLCSCWWYYIFLSKGEKKRKKTTTTTTTNPPTSVQVWDLWLSAVHFFLAFPSSVAFFVVALCVFVELKGRHFRCTSGNVGGRPLSSQYVRIIVYSIPYVPTEMQWIVWFNIKMWFIFTVNGKSFKFASVHIHYILGLQTSKLWMIQIVHNNNKMSSHIPF